MKRVVPFVLLFVLVSLAACDAPGFLQTGSEASPSPGSSPHDGPTDPPSLYFR